MGLPGSGPFVGRRLSTGDAALPTKQQDAARPDGLPRDVLHWAEDIESADAGSALRSCNEAWGLRQRTYWALLGVEPGRPTRSIQQRFKTTLAS